jgi:predicted small lipoprotein YifL
MTRRRLWPNSSVFILLCCLGLLLGGCGKKGPPEPPRQEELPKVKNLKAVVVDTGVKLTWTTDSNDDIAAGFNIYRSKVQSEISDCPGCTPEFEVVTTIRVKAGETRFELIDQYFEGKGRFYYKVTPFDKQDRPGPDSNESMVVIE